MSRSEVVRWTRSYKLSNLPLAEASEMLSHAVHRPLRAGATPLRAVAEGETLVVVSQLYERADYAESFLAAAPGSARTGSRSRFRKRRSASAVCWRLTVGATPPTHNRAAVEALKQADIVVDRHVPAHSKELVEIQESGRAS